jgi:hypothetical protein
MDKYGKNQLNNFKRLWTDANFNKMSEMDEEILNDVNDEIRWLSLHMKKMC